MKCWTRYVDDTLCYIKTDSIDYVLKMLNGFHRNIQFTYDVETDSKISYLDALVISDSSNNINTTVYRKSTNNDIYLNWESFAPGKWKWGTLKTLTKRAYDVCSNQELLKLKKYFVPIITTLIGWLKSFTASQTTATPTTNSGRCSKKEPLFITPL